MSKLTVAKVRNSKPKTKPYKLSDGHGMHLHIAPSGLKTWRYRFQVNGKESTYTLGEYPHMSLEKARKARMEARQLVREGINPAKLRKENKERKKREQTQAELAMKNTFQSIAIEWHITQRSGWSVEHSKAVLNTLQKDVFPHIGDLPINTITPPMILDILRRIEARGSLEIARKVLQRMNAVFRYAVQTGLIGYNPASDMKGMLKPKKVVHRSSLSEEEMPKFLKLLKHGDIHTTTKLALQFTILTATRSIEVRGATWDEININKKLWSIPPERMKMDSPHTVPLPVKKFIGWLQIQSSKYYNWIERYGKSNEHNGLIPRDFWMEDWEKQAIIDYHHEFPHEGYKRLKRTGQLAL